MKKVINKFLLSDIYRSFCYEDMGAWELYIYKKKGVEFILLDNDREGNARWGFLSFGLKNNRIFLNDGAFLKANEKGKSWDLSKYNSCEELTEKISKFTLKYFGSWKTIRK